MRRGRGGFIRRDFSIQFESSNLLPVSLSNSLPSSFFFCKRVLDELPGANWVLLQHLLCVLHHILQSADTNKMDAYNLAVCIGPTLLQLDGVPLDEQKDRIEKVGGGALATTAPPLLSLL